MKHLRLVALVIAAAAWSAVTAVACPDDGKGASAANASGSCSAHGAHATTAAAPMDCCAGKGASASSAANSCSAHGARSAAAKGAVGCAGAGAVAGMVHCDMRSAAMHGDCSVCTDEATCSNDLRGAGVRSQVVALRNGAMIVYTAENSESVRALQTTVARYNQHIMSAYAGASDATLCGGCKSFRGAMASGKFSRELVNVKNGCQILLTSTDRDIVRKIHDSMGTQVAARTRS